MRPHRWITDLRHLMTSNDKLVSARSASLPVYLSMLVEAATASPAGAWAVSPVRCRLRPAHKCCHGRTRVYRADSSDPIEWACLVCGASGSIAGWQATPWDLRNARTKAPASGHDSLVELSLSDDEYAGLRLCAGLRPVHRVMVAGAVPRGDRVVLCGRPDELRALKIGLEAAEARNTRQRRALRSLRNRLASVLRPRDQQPPPRRW